MLCSASAGPGPSPRVKEATFAAILSLPGGTVPGNPPANAGDTGSIPGLEDSHVPRSKRSPGTAAEQGAVLGALCS